jgi:hypothetical protein
LPAVNQRVAELQRIKAEQRCTCNDNPGRQEMAIRHQAAGVRHQVFLKPDACGPTPVN